MTDTSYAPSNDALRAEILLWQAPFRVGAALCIGGLGLMLRVLGLASQESVLLPWLGANRAALGFAAVAVLYVAWIAVLRRHLRACGLASRRLVATVLAVDVSVLYLGAMFLTPPGQLTRTLIITMFILQFTQLYFGWRSTLFQLGVTGAWYGMIVVLAYRAGIIAEPSELLWNFVVFCLGALAYARVLGHQGARMRRLTRLFDRAREGEFDESYELSRDRFPDHITQIGRSYNELRGHLETIILTDPLSGCFNRRGFKQLAEREVSRSVRAKGRMAMLALDVDHFKRINDEFGHLTGDEAIKEIGALVRETARAGDVVARIGGEEFSILAPDTDDAGAQHLADRVLEAFRTRRFASVRGQLPITTSIGVASDEAATDDVIRTLTARADEALYVAKRNGRDQAVLWRTGMRAFEGARPSRDVERMP